MPIEQNGEQKKDIGNGHRHRLTPHDASEPERAAAPASDPSGESAAVMLERVLSATGFPRTPHHANRAR